MEHLALHAKVCSSKGIIIYYMSDHDEHDDDTGVSVKGLSLVTGSRSYCLNFWDLNASYFDMTLCCELRSKFVLRGLLFSLIYVALFPKEYLSAIVLYRDILYTVLFARVCSSSKCKQSGNAEKKYIPVHNIVSLY